jgi:hypothetical protein
VDHAARHGVRHRPLCYTIIRPGEARQAGDHPTLNRKTGLAESNRYIIGFNGETTFSVPNVPVPLVSSCGWRRRANLIVRISLLERTEMLEDVKRYLEGRPCDLHM